MARGRGRPRGRSGPTAKTRLAARLYASGACETKRAAALAVGLHPSYFTLVSSPGSKQFQPEVKRIMDEVEQAIQDKTVDMSAVLQTVGREALLRMRGLMKDSQNEAIVVKAAADLLDRSPETSKIHKHQVAAFSVSGDDAKLLAAAMVRSAQARESSEGLEAASGDFVRVPLEQHLDEAGEAQVDITVAGAASKELEDARQGLLSGTPGQVDEEQRPDASAIGSGEVDSGASGPSASEAQSGPAPQADAAQGPITDERRLRLIKGDG